MKAEESSIPTGRRFLPGNTAESMRAKQPGEADPKAAERLLAYIMRKEGKSIRQICAALNRPYPAVRNWLVRAVQAAAGLDARGGPGSVADTAGNADGMAGVPPTAA